MFLGGRDGGGEVAIRKRQNNPSNSMISNNGVNISKHTEKLAKFYFYKFHSLIEFDFAWQNKKDIDRFLEFFFRSRIILRCIYIERNKIYPTSTYL